MQRSYKPASFMGRKVEFVVRNGRVWARVPSISRQFVGYGKTKRTAFEDAKSTLKSVIKARARRK